VNPGGAAKTRRHSAVALVAGISLFVALIAGSALRPQVAATALPEPVAWSQGAPDVGAHADQPLRGRSPTVSHLAHLTSWGAAPTNKKPFRSMWMTKERPSTWTRLSPQSVRSSVPASVAALKFQPRGTPYPRAADVGAKRDILTRLCIARR
jgi:hypothetical protein